MLIFDKVNIRVKKITRSREGYFILKKASIHQEDIIILHGQAPKNSLKILKQNLMELMEKEEKSSITVENFNALFQ